MEEVRSSSLPGSTKRSKARKLGLRPLAKAPHLRYPRVELDKVNYMTHCLKTE